MNEKTYIAMVNLYDIPLWHTMSHDRDQTVQAVRNYRSVYNDTHATVIELNNNSQKKLIKRYGLNNLTCDLTQYTEQYYKDRFAHQKQMLKQKQQNQLKTLNESGNWTPYQKISHKANPFMKGFMTLLLISLPVLCLAGFITLFIQPSTYRDFIDMILMTLVCGGLEWLVFKFKINDHPNMVAHRVREINYNYYCNLERYAGSECLNIKKSPKI